MGSHGGGGPADALPPMGGLATLRRDGFASLQPPGHIGFLTTHPLTMRRAQLHLNAKADGGQISCAIIDERGSALPGYAHQDCVPAGADHVDQVLRWKEEAHIPSGENLRLELQVHDAALYAFWLQ